MKGEKKKDQHNNQDIAFKDDHFYRYFLIDCYICCVQSSDLSTSIHSKECKEITEETKVSNSTQTILPVVTVALLFLLVNGMKGEKIFFGQELTRNLFV